MVAISPSSIWRRGSCACGMHAGGALLVGALGYPDGCSAHRAHARHPWRDIETSIIARRVSGTGCGAKKSRISAGNLRDGARYTWLRADFPAGFGWMTQDLHASGAVAMRRSRAPGRARPRSIMARGVYRIAQGCGKVRSAGPPG